jgi:hypothetical protein
MEEVPRLLELARYCLDHAKRGYADGGANGASEKAQQLLNVANQLVTAIQADIAMEDAGMVVSLPRFRGSAMILVNQAG